MNREKTLTLDREKTLYLTKLIVLLGIATVVPLFHQQMITGPIVNATLFASVILLGTQAGIMVGIIPSIIALSVGTLPAPLAPMVPYIMLGNVLLVLVFGFLKDKNYWLAVGVSSVAKFAWLFATSTIVIDLLLKKDLAQSVASMMSWPQLLTALLGGLVVWSIFKRK